MRHLIAASGLLLCFALAAASQEPRTNTRSVHIDGVVIDGATDRRLPSVVVQVGGAKATTNREGRFSLDGVESGKQILVAERAGYLRARVDKHKSSGGFGLPMTLTPGQTLRDLTLYVQPAGAVSGRIFDAQGKPVVNAALFVFRSMFDEFGGKSFFNAISNTPVMNANCGLTAETRMVSPTMAETRTRGGTTDDRGEFRIYNLEPGRYGLCIRAGGMFFIYPNASDWNSATLLDIGIGTDLRLNTTVLPKEIVLSSRGGGARGRSTEATPEAAPPLRNGELRGRAVVEVPGSTPKGAAGVEITYTHERLSALARLSSQTSGSFIGGTVPQGVIRLRSIRNTPEGKCLRSVRQGNRDVFKEGILVEGNGAEFTITFGDSPAALRGKTSPGAFVVLVPDEAERFGFFSAAKADQDGAYQIPCVMSGAYSLYAWLELDGEAYRNAEFMKKYEGRRKPVRIEGGESLDVTVTVLD